MNASPSLEFDVDARHRPVRQAGSRRPASTTRRSSGRAASGRSTRGSCGSAAGLGRLRPPPGRARVADRVPPPPRRRAGDRRRRRRAWPPRCEPPRWAPTWSWSTTARSSVAPCSPATGADARRVSSAPGFAAAGVEVLAPAAALGFFDGIVPVWCAEHAASDPRRAPRRRHRLDRAAADVRGQRPSRGDALLRRASGSPPSTGCGPGSTRGRRDDRRPRRSSRRSPCARRASRSRAVADARRAGPTRSSWRGWSARGSRCCAARAVVRAFGRRRVKGAVVARPRRGGRAGRRTPSAASTAIWSPSPAAPSRRPRCCSRPAPRRAGTRPRGAYLPDAAPAGHPHRGRGRRPRLGRPGRDFRAPSPAPRQRSRSSSATTPTAPAARRRARR